MKIAICDDCLEDIKFLEGLIRKSKRCPVNLDFYEFSSGKALLANYTDFDAIFLDMLMEGMDGKQTAEDIRKRDSKVILSFYSGYESAANEVMRSRPYGYLMKNSKKEVMLSEIEMVLMEAEKREQLPRLPVICDGKVFLLDLSSILYISIYNKGSRIWITDARAEEIWGAKWKPEDTAINSSVKMDAYYEELKNFGFIYASKSYIVNSENVVARIKDTIKLKGGHEIGISRSRKKSFDREFSRFWGIKYNRIRVKQS